MSRRIGTAGRATRRPVIVIAGEDSNDRKAVRVVLEAVCPDMRGHLVEINDSVRLRQATGQTLTSRVRTLYRKAKAKAVGQGADLACVFIHEDWDSVDGAEWAAAQARVQRCFDHEVGPSHYVLAVWEIEAWLLLFPNAFPAVVSSWQVPARLRGKDTGLLTDPKRAVRLECCGQGRAYTEADAVAILAVAADADGLTANGTNRSWAALTGNVERCCAAHLPSSR